MIHSENYPSQSRKRDINNCFLKRTAEMLDIPTGERLDVCCDLCRTTSRSGGVFDRSFFFFALLPFVVTVQAMPLPHHFSSMQARWQ
jgi:hypothetical protein